MPSLRIITSSFFEYLGYVTRQENRLLSLICNVPLWYSLCRLCQEESVLLLVVNQALCYLAVRVSSSCSDYSAHNGSLEVGNW